MTAFTSPGPSSASSKAALAALGGGVGRVRIGSLECIPDAALGTAVVSTQSPVLTPRDHS